MFWKTKESNHILWIDIETELDIEPDLILDCTNTEFPDNSVMMIFFDPPHWWGDKIADNFYTIRNKNDREHFNEKYGTHFNGAYYGTDKYHTKRQLLNFLHRAQEEFKRILYPDGVLWLNWSEVKLELDRIMPFFRDWDEMLRLPVGSKNQIMSTYQNYWVMLMKKDRPHPQTMLTSFSKSKRIDEA